MSLTAAMNSAMTGLSAVTRATELVAGNIANAATPGYGRRTLELSSFGAGQSGVNVVGVLRHSDLVLLGQRRAADAQVAHTEIRTSFYDRVSLSIGLPGDMFGLSARLADFEASLIEAASRPDQMDRLSNAVQQAVELSDALRSASDDIQTQRQQADQAISGLVEELNTGLSRLQDTNVQITSVQSAGGDVAGLLDQRQQVLDTVNTIVPVTVVDRGYGQIALYSEGGTVLLDGQAAQVEFTVATAVGPGTTLENGGLSGLTLNGIPLRTGSTDGALRGGRLGAQFALRDEWAPQAQSALDVIARDLVERFSDPAVDPTLSAGAPGLFTDNGAALDATETTGLAGRLRVNAAVDPAQGGEAWRLRDGMEATAPGDTGQAAILHALSDALAAPKSLSSDTFGAGTFTAATAMSALSSQFQTQLAQAEDAQGFASATRSELLSVELAQGVDTDAELQSLILLEQNYAANAKVLETIDTLLGELMRI